MSDDFMEEWIDPFEMLMEHQQIIGKLVKAHNQQEQIISSLLHHNKQLTDELIKVAKRLTDMENK